MSGDTIVSVKIPASGMVVIVLSPVPPNVTGTIYVDKKSRTIYPAFDLNYILLFELKQKIKLFTIYLFVLIYHFNIIVFLLCII